MRPPCGPYVCACNNMRPLSQALHKVVEEAVKEEMVKMEKFIQVYDGRLEKIMADYKSTINTFSKTVSVMSELVAQDKVCGGATGFCISLYYYGLTP